jgi:hypothetical protein
MRFLLKMFVLGFIGLAILPAFAPSEYRDASASIQSDSAPTPSPYDIASLVGQAAADIRGLCDRQPEVCRTGGDLVSYASSRAREGLDIAYAMFRHGHPSMKEPESGNTPEAE